MLPTQSLHFGGEFPVTAQCQVSLGSDLGRYQDQLVQVRPLGISEDGVGELGQRITPAQAERFAQCGRCQRRLTVSRQPPSLGHQLGEADDIDIIGADGEGVPALASENRRRPEGAAQLSDLGLQGVGRVGRLTIAPQHSDQPVSRSAVTGRPRCSALRRPAQAGDQDRSTAKEGRTMIEAQHLTKRYGTTAAVDEVSFAPCSRMRSSS